MCGVLNLCRTFQGNDMLLFIIDQTKYCNRPCATGCHAKKCEHHHPARLRKGRCITNNTKSDKLGTVFPPPTPNSGDRSKLKFQTLRETVGEGFLFWRTIRVNFVPCTHQNTPPHAAPISQEQERRDEEVRLQMESLRALQVRLSDIKKARRRLEKARPVF